MRNKNVLNLRRSLPCMSWSPKNLYNLWVRTVGPKSYPLRFTNSAAETLFQQRWKAKAAVRAYHGDYIPEKSFKRWYLPDNLPDVRPRRKVIAGDDKLDLEEYARRKVREEDLEREIEKKGMAPVGSLMLTEVERRIDVFVFRCCFAHSIYEARRLVIHGDVWLNGKKHTNANTRLAPGDMVSVNPNAIRFIKPNTPGYVDNVNYKPKPKPISHAKPTPEEPVDKAEAEEAETTEGTSSAVATAGTSSLALEPKPHVKNSRFRNRDLLTPFNLPKFASPWLFVPSYIEVSYATCSAVYVRHPTARPGYSEIPTPYDADGPLLRFAWEWYVQRKPRMRSKNQLARMPEDRALVRLREMYEEDVKLKKALWETGSEEAKKKAKDPLTVV